MRLTMAFCSVSMWLQSSSHISQNNAPNLSAEVCWRLGRDSTMFCRAPETNRSCSAFPIFLLISFTATFLRWKKNHNDRFNFRCSDLRLNPKDSCALLTSTLPTSSKPSLQSRSGSPSERLDLDSGLLWGQEIDICLVFLSNLYFLSNNWCFYAGFSYFWA